MSKYKYSRRQIRKKITHKIKELETCCGCKPCNATVTGLLIAYQLIEQEKEH